MSARPGPVRKAVFVGLLTLAAIAILESASIVALAVRDGLWPSPARWRQERAHATLEAGGPLAAGHLARGIDPAGMQVIHPYVGFVLNPEFKGIDWREVTPDGFQRPPRTVDPPAGVPRFVVAVFGGSVAGGFCLQGREAFVQELERVPAVRGKAVVMRCLAMGGYKQPQQLMALAQALSLGETIDLVVNFDGFNEVVLPIAENLAGGVHPFYPRGWPARVAGAPSVDTLRTVGRITVWKDERLQRAALCARPPLGWSPSCHLVWTTLDRRLARRVFEAERTLAGGPPPDQGFLVRGPAFDTPSRPEMCRMLAEHWARSSTLMADIARVRGIRYVHVLQPNQYVAGSKPMSEAERRVAVDPANPYRRPVEDCYPSLIEMGRALAGRGVPFHDLTGVFARHPEPLYTDTCCHYNLEGQRLVGHAIGRLAAQALAGS